MKKLAIFTLVLWTLISCSTSNQSSKEESTMDSAITEILDTLNQFSVPDTTPELVNEGPAKIIEESISFDLARRPNRPVFKNIKVDTSELFGIWTVDPTGPHADFTINKDRYYVVDYDGNGEVTYILDQDSITIFFEDGKLTGRITTNSNDTLRIAWDYGLETEYYRWNN